MRLLASALVVASLFSVAVAHGEARRPAFVLSALGVLGGDTDTNLSAFLLERAGHPEARLLLDGGTVVEGAARLEERAGRLARDASPTARAMAARALLDTMDAALVTHAHLDHTAGLVVGAAPLLLGRAPSRPPLPLVGLPETIAALHDQLLAPPAWVDWTRTPPGHPTLQLAPLAPSETRRIGAFAVTAIPLTHAIPSAAFLVEADGAFYLHLGDTGPTEAVWRRARTLVGKGLRAVAIECSFPSQDEALARATGHLTPRLLVEQLALLAGVAPSPDAAARRVAIARALVGVRIVVMHIKATAFDRVVAELEPLRRAGLDLVVPAQGDTLSF